MAGAGRGRAVRRRRTGASLTWLNDSNPATTRHRVPSVLLHAVVSLVGQVPKQCMSAAKALCWALGGVAM